MASQWFYNRQGVKFGPVTTDQLKMLAASEQIPPTDLLWKEGMTGWIPAGKLNKLFPRDHADQSTPLTTGEQVSSMSLTGNKSSKSIVKRLIFLGGTALLVLVVIALIVGKSNLSNLPMKIEKDVNEARSRLVVSPSSIGSVSVTPKFVGPDFSNVDYSFDFVEDNYKFDFSKVDYSKGPQGQPLLRHLIYVDHNQKSYPEETATDWERNQAQTVEEQWGYKNPAGDFIQHGPDRVHGRHERAILKSEVSKGEQTTKKRTAQEWKDYANGIIEIELTEVLGESFYYDGKLHGPTKTWGPTTEISVNDELHQTPSAVQTSNRRIPGPLLSDGAYLNGEKFGKWTEWKYGEEDSQNGFVRPIYKYSEVYWLHGRRNGPAAIFYPDGRIQISGICKEDKFHGKQSWLTLNPESGGGDSETLLQDAGQMKLAGRGEAYFLDDQLHGSLRTWYPTGEKFVEMSFVHGSPTGTAMVFHKNGQLRFSLSFSNGKANGVFDERWDNGLVCTKGAYKDDQKDGLWTTWRPDGTKAMDGLFVTGKSDGLHRRWYPQEEGGNLAEEENYDHGIRNGQHKIYYRKIQTGGKELAVWQEDMWDEGKLKRYIEYDTDGNVTKEQDN